MSNEVTGLVKKIGEVKTFGANGFRKRELVLTIPDEKYPQHVSIDFTQDKSDLLNEISVGDNLKIQVNIGGREWINPQGEAKYFNSVTGWRIESAGEATPTPAPANIGAVAQGEPDDLPF